MASFCGGCSGRPPRQAGWWRRDCLSLEKWEGGQVSPSANPRPRLFDPLGEAHQDTGEMDSAQDCRATSLDRARLSWVKGGVHRRLYSIGYAVSGHTLKHLAAAAACFAILRYFQTRRSIPFGEPSEITA